MNLLYDTGFNDLNNIFAERPSSPDEAANIIAFSKGRMFMSKVNLEVAKKIIAGAEEEASNIGCKW